MGSANENCKICMGEGVVQNDLTPPHPPTYRRCECVLRQDILNNVERGMKGLTKVSPLSSPSPLLGKENSNIWISSGGAFLSHLRYVAIRQPPTWSFKIASDAELVTAWLGSIALKGQDILDPDAYLVSTKFITITDLVTPPDLLVIRMGIKVARNQASSEVLAEAINTRIHEGKPTWLWDEPNYPLNPGHMFWSDQVGLSISGWQKLVLAELDKTKVPRVVGNSSGVSPVSGSPNFKKSLRGQK
jgi:hypothetical protein